MNSREELFKETEDRIDQTTNELRKYFFDLGIMMFHNPDILPSQMGVSLIKATKEAEDNLKNAQEKEQSDALFILEFDKKKERKLEVDGLLEELREEERDNRLKLGALIYEQCSLSLLPRESFSSVYDDVDEEKILNEKTQSKSFWSRFTSSSALNRMKRSDTTRYLDYSSFADNPTVAATISGEKAQNLINELNEIKDKRDSLQSEEEELEEYITSSVNRRRSLEKGESEDNELLVEEKKTAFNECVINYGNYLYDRGANWIGEETPADVLDILQHIIEKQNEYSSLVLERNRLEKEAKADDYKALIEEEKEKIRILENEKSKIDSQIDEIKREIERLENTVSRLIKSQDQE